MGLVAAPICELFGLGEEKAFVSEKREFTLNRLAVLGRGGGAG